MIPPTAHYGYRVLRPEVLFSFQRAPVCWRVPNIDTRNTPRTPMKKFLALAAAALAALSLAGCGVNPVQATTTLEAMGMTNIKIGGYAVFGCDKNDTFRSTFNALGATGKPVSGVVCSGFMKGTTVRFQ